MSDRPGQATADEPRVGFTVPIEGAGVFVDHLAVPRRAPNPRAAHAFLNYVLRPEVAAEIAEQTGYGPANGAALSQMKTPIVPPDAETMRRLEFDRDPGAARDLIDRLWTEVVKDSPRGYQRRQPQRFTFFGKFQLISGMLYYFGMIMAVIGASALIGALTYVTLMHGVVITSMFAFTAAPILDKIFKES